MALHDVSNHRRLDCFLNRLFRRRLKKPASLAVVKGVHRWPVDSPHKGPLSWEMFPFDDVIMISRGGMLDIYRKYRKHGVRLSYMVNTMTADIIASWRGTRANSEKAWFLEKQVKSYEELYARSRYPKFWTKWDIGVWSFRHMTSCVWQKHVSERHLFI